jgi:hypothetical protein
VSKITRTHVWAPLQRFAKCKLLRLRRTGVSDLIGQSMYVGRPQFMGSLQRIDCGMTTSRTRQRNFTQYEEAVKGGRNGPFGAGFGDRH